MTVSEKRKNKKTETSGKNHKSGKSHKKIVKILQKKKREKLKKEADPILKSGEKVVLSATECALKLTGLPFSATEKDVQDWFEGDGIKVENIYMCGKSRKTGMAYVTVEKKSAMRKGLAKHKQNMGERYINVEVKKKTEMSEVLQLAEIMDKSVFLRGLPFEVYRLDILRFFKGLDIAPRGIHIKNRGFGIVEFTDSKMVQEALDKNNEYIRDRYIKVFPCRMKNLVEMRDQIFEEKKKGVDSIKNSEREETRKTSVTHQEEMEADEEEIEAGEDPKAESSGEESVKDAEMKEESVEKSSDSDDKPEESENEEKPPQKKEELEEEKPKKGKRKSVVAVVQDKFSPRRLRSRTGTPIKSPAKRLGKGSARKSKK